MLSATFAGVTRNASNRALKRLRGHPKHWRPAPEDLPAVGELRWNPVEVEVPPTGWMAPLADATPADLPFAVERTELGQQLPVYSDYRHARTKQYTIVRKVEGDVETFTEELSKVCGGADVTTRPGRIEVAGDHRKAVRSFLYGLGF